MERLRPYFPKSGSRCRVYDRRVLSGVILINRNGLRWCNGKHVNATNPRDHSNADYDPPKTLYNRWKRWGYNGVFART